MKKQILKLKINYIISPLVIIIIAAVLRIIPHPPNMAPIAAMALFGGAYLDKKYAIIIPLLALFFSDIFLGFYGMEKMAFVYGSFLIIGCIGIWLKNHKKPTNIINATLLSSLLFYLITNFGVWLLGTIYPKTFSGLIDCFVAAIPFFTNTIIGDFLYTGLFFMGYEAALRFRKNILTVKAKNNF